MPGKEWAARKAAPVKEGGRGSQRQRRNGGGEANDRGGMGEGEAGAGGGKTVTKR